MQFINPPPDIGLKEKLDALEDTTVEVATGGVIWEALHFQTENVPDLRIRQAIAYGTNRQQILDKILKGVVDPLESVLMPEQAPYYTPAWERYTYDPDRARQLVKEAKAEGASTTISFSTTTDNALRETLQEIAQQQLKDVGLTIEINNESATTYFSKTTVNGDFDVGEWAWLTTPGPFADLALQRRPYPPGRGELLPLQERSGHRVGGRGRQNPRQGPAGEAVEAGAGANGRGPAGLSSVPGTVYTAFTPA